MDPRNESAPGGRGAGGLRLPLAGGTDHTTCTAFSRGRDKFDAYPEQRTATSWDGFITALLADRSATKGLAYLSAPLRANGDGRHHRCRDGVLPRCWLALDNDGCPPGSFALLCMRLAEYQGVGWLTASSTRECSRFRAILALDRTVDRSEGVRLGAVLVRRLSEGLDDVQWDESTHRGEQPCYLPLNGAENMRWTGEPVDVDALLAIASPIDEKPGARERGERIKDADPVVRRLAESGLIKRDLGGGKLSIVCPFDSSHTEPGGESSTVYMLAHFNGVRTGKFHCLHSHCQGRSQSEFLEAIGVRPNSDLPPVEGYAGEAGIDLDDPPFDAYERYSEAEPGAARGEDARGPHGDSKDNATAGVSGGEEWPEPMPLTAKVDPEPYPLDALPDTIRAAVEEVRGFTKAPIPLVASSALGVLSLAIQPHADAKRAEKLAGPVGLYQLTIADSGERKSTCDGFFTKSIRDYEEAQAEAAKPALKDHKAAIEAWEAKQSGIKDKIRQLAKESKPTDGMETALRDLEHDKPEPPRVPHLLYVDATPEALAYGLAKHWPSGGVVSAEAGIVFGAHGMGKDSVMRNLALLNVLWDGGNLTIDRRTTESFTVRGARLTVALQVQEATLRSFFDRFGPLVRGSGFLARFLVAWPESTQGFRAFTEAPANWPALAAFNHRIAAILDQPAPIDDEGTLTPPLLPLTAAAKSAWVSFHDAIEGELASGGELYDVRDVASKTADNAARLAALFQVFEGAGGAIGVDAFDSASRVVAWHLNESRRFFGELALPAELANAVRLDTWLIGYCRGERVTAVPKNHIRQHGPGSLRSKSELDAALAELVEQGRARLVKSGRRVMVQVNPALLASAS